MDSTTLTGLGEEPKEKSKPEMKSWYAALQQISDGRKKRGVRYSVALVVSLLLLAKLAGETSISRAAHWVRLREKELLTSLPVKLSRLPCLGTYLSVLQHLDGEEVTRVLREYFTRLTSPKQTTASPTQEQLQAHQQPTRQVAMDGKTMRGTWKHERADQARVHVLAMHEVQTGTVLAQRQVYEKENQISAAPALMTLETVSGRVLSADAMQTQRLFCLRTVLLQGDYLLIAKDTQPSLHADLALFFEDPEADRCQWQTARTCEKGHGRLETRTITTSTDLAAYFAKDWAGIAQVFRLERTVVKKGVTRTEVVYGFTSLSPKQAEPKELLGFVRAHWASENRLHWRRDETLGEDRSQVRTGRSPEILAALNNTALSLMDSLHVSNVRAHLRVFAAHPQQALRLFLNGS